MTNNLYTELTPETLSVIKELDTPDKIQKYIDTEIKYDSTREDRTIDEVATDKIAECYNGALLATACLIYHGYEASIIELLAKDDEEHIICVYKENGGFGSITQSKFLGLKGRKPIYSSIHDLAVSYMEFYIAFEDGHYSLESHTDWFPIDKYNLEWLSNRETIVKMEKDLRKEEHFNLRNNMQINYTAKPERFWAEVKVIPEGTTLYSEFLEYKEKENQKLL